MTSMTTTKTQLRGHCQCCGRQQAVPKRGTMAHHGYEVQDGYFSGVCQGHQYEPIERDTTIVVSVIASVRRQAVGLRQHAADLRSGRVTPEIVRGDWNAATREYDMIPFDGAPKWRQEQAVEAAAYQYESRGRAADSFSDGLKAIVAERAGKPLIVVPVEAGSAPVQPGERKVAPRGVLTAVYVERGMVRWKDDRGYTSKMSTRSWRNLPDAT